MSQKLIDFLIHFSDLCYNVITYFFCRNMEILPNLYFADLYRRSYNSSKNPKDNEINGQAARSRHTVEVVIRNSSVRQFLSHDLSNNVATIL